MNEKLTQIFSAYSASLLQLIPKLITASIVFACFIIIGWVVARIVAARMGDTLEKGIVGQVSSDIVKWGFWILGIMIVLHIMGFGTAVSNLIAGAGISAVVLGFAFRDIAQNFISGLMLAANRPFKTGDLIEVAGNKGRVVKMDLRTVHIRMPDGRDIYIPNSMVIENVFINYTKDGLLRQDFVVGLDTEADLVEARKLIQQELMLIPGVLEAPRSEVIVEEIGESSVNVRVLFWIDQIEMEKKASTFEEPSRKSVAVRRVRDVLLKNGFTLPSAILEHKMYNSKDPITIQINDNLSELPN